MPTNTPLEIKKTYNFNTRAPAILGASFKRAIVLGIFDYNIATNYITPETRHANIYPYLPTGTVDDPKEYAYILIQTESGDKTCLALPWIDESSVTLVATRTLRITAKADDPLVDTKIRDALLLLGVTDLTIEYI